MGVGFPYFGGEHDELLTRNVPARRIRLADGTDALVATVYDLQMANYGLDRGLGGGNVATSYDDDVPYTPAWQEKHTSVPRAQVIQVAREFAQNAHDTQGKSMVIVGAGLNHWYHMDMIYRGIINMLMMCGCVARAAAAGRTTWARKSCGRSSAGAAGLRLGLGAPAAPDERHLVLLRPHQPVASREAERAGSAGPHRRPRQVRRTQHDRPERPRRARAGCRRRRSCAPIRWTWWPRPRPPAGPGGARRRGPEVGALQMACENPDDPANFPRNMFVWRSNILGSSGKGHEYFLKYLLGTQNAVFGDEADAIKPVEVAYEDDAAEGKLDLLTVLDFRMSTTCLYGDIVLPTATWYEKDDLNTSDMHPFIHPLSEAVQPLWESKTDWEIYKLLAKRFSEIGGLPGQAPRPGAGSLDARHPGRTGPALRAQDWKLGECDLVPGKTAPNMVVVERDYNDIYRKFTSVGPLLDKLGNGGKGINWNTEHEVRELAGINDSVSEPGVSQGRPRLDTAIDAAEMILTFAPETNGHVSVKAWEALSKITGREHAHLAIGREHDKIRFRDIQAQPRKIISAPTWSGLESEEVSYNAGYTNVHELIPWRTLTGRQQFYQDHRWMLDFGEGFCVYKPAIDTKTVAPMLGRYPNGEKELVLNWLTPHQKWGIHSTYSDNLRMLTLSRGGPHVWISEAEARQAGLVDNDWVEVFNVNGTLTARVVVSQRVPVGMCLMYHAQEKIVNVPGAETSGKRGGIHNSVTRTVLKPTHMIGGYAQQAYGFNYYGTVGANRDEFVVLRKMKKVDWLEGPLVETQQEEKQS